LWNTDADISESESDTSDSGSEIELTHISSSWLQVTDCDSGLITSISAQNTECNTPVLIAQLSLFNIFFHLSFDMDLLKLILQKTILNGNEQKM
jgi:hypothetical protein